MAEISGVARLTKPGGARNRYTSQTGKVGVPPRGAGAAEPPAAGAARIVNPTHSASVGSSRKRNLGDDWRLERIHRTESRNIADAGHWIER